MGSNFAIDLASGMGGISFEDAIRSHLVYNHYPPVPVVMAEPCIEAIDAYWEAELDRLIKLPSGVSWKGQDSAPAYALINSHHLEAWCTEYEEEEI